MRHCCRAAGTEKAREISPVAGRFLSINVQKKQIYYYYQHGVLVL